jgi:acyl-CoA thioester hydrolase
MNHDEPATHWLPLRFRDLDAFGHVYHAEYLTLLDEARAAFLDRLGIADPTEYLVAHLEIDYVDSLVLADGCVRGEFEPIRVGATSLTLQERLVARDGRVVSRGRAVIVLRDPSSGRKRALADDERARLLEVFPQPPA